MNTLKTQPIQTASCLTAKLHKAMEVFWTARRYKRGIALGRQTLTGASALPVRMENKAVKADTLAALGHMFAYHAEHGRKTNRRVRLGFAQKFYSEALIILDQVGGDPEDIALVYRGAAQSFAATGSFSVAYDLLHKAFLEVTDPGSPCPMTKEQVAYLTGQSSAAWRLGHQSEALQVFDGAQRCLETSLRGLDA